MTDQAQPYGDPITAPFWAAAREHRLLLQSCPDSGTLQLYPRRFDITSGSDRVEWVEASGGGTIYALTEVHRKVDPALEPPYVVALVDLDEGPRLLTNLVGEGKPAIGDRVALTWRARGDLPPLPVFELLGD